MVGLNPSKAEIDATIGDLSRATFHLTRRIQHFKYYLDGKTDPELTTIGYDPTDIANLRSIAQKLDKLREVWEGVSVLTPAEDLRTFPRRAAGMGDV